MLAWKMTYFGAVPSICAIMACRSPTRCGLRTKSRQFRHCSQEA